MTQPLFTQISPADKRKDLYFLLAVALWLLLPSGLRNLAIPDEGRYADVARWMVVSGDWLIPRENGLPFFHKPPLLYWIDAGLFSVFGIHVWVARLAPVLAGMVMCGGTFWFVRRRLGSATARLSTLVLSTSMLVFGASQYVNHDMMVAAWISLAVFCFSDGLITARTGPLLVGYLACALALMSKGLIGVALPGLVMLPWLIVTGRWRQLGRLLNPLGILLFLAVALPWFVLVQMKYPGFFHYFFIEQQFQRYTTAGFNNKQPWWFYIACMLLLSLPWPLLVPRAGLWKSWLEKMGRELTLLMLIWLAAVVGFFSIPQSKLVGYILPAMPPFAIMLAIAVQDRRVGRFKKAASGALIAILGIVLLLAIKHAGFLTDSDRTVITSACAALIVGGVLLAALQLRDRLSVIGANAVAAALWGLVVIVVIAVGDDKNNADDVGVQKWLEPGTEMVFYRHFWYDIPFLLNRRSATTVVEDWPGVTSDTWAREQKDGVQFDAVAAQKLWGEAELQQAMDSGRRMLLLSTPRLVPVQLRGTEPVYRGQNFDAFLVNGGSRTPSSGSGQTSSPPPAPAR